MEKEQKKIMLLLTEECNLACSYCYEHHKRPRAMDFSQARRIIDDHYAETAPGETVLIEVFGGEPFLNFPLMQRIDDYVMTTYGDRVNLFETTTNGTLVHGEMQSWLAARRDRWRVSLSLDGTQAMHDRNRPLKGGGSSYAQIDRAFFLRTWPGTAQAKLTLSEQTLPQLAEGVISLHEQGFVVDATLSTGVDWDFAANEQIFVRELAKLVEFYSAHPELPLCTLLNFDLRLVFAERPSELRFCGAGEMTCCYDAAGGCYPCQGFAPVALGAEAAAFKDFDAQKFSLTADNPCVRCPFFFLCDLCYSANLATTGSLHRVDPNLCRAYRLCILASARVQFACVSRKRRLAPDDRLVLGAVRLVQEECQRPAPWQGAA